MLRCRLTWMWLIAVGATSNAADREIFSGPQVGEKLVPFTLQGALHDDAGKRFDLVARADGGPICLIFVHEVTRPSIGLTRLVMKYAAQREPDGLISGVVFLTDDMTATANWMRRASHALPQGVPVGISPAGVEGPGAYGLNRNVTLTVLIADEHRVRANFALIQPSIQADGPKILRQIVEVMGGGEVPTLGQLQGRRYAGRKARTKD